MSEAREGCALLDNVEESTFVRFSQYAYTGDYVAAKPDILLDSSTIPKDTSLQRKHDEREAPPTIDDYSVSFTAEEPAATDDPFSNPYRISSSSKKEKKEEVYVSGEVADSELPMSHSKKSRLWNNFKNEVYTISLSDFEPRRNQKPCEDYTKVFLCHAHVYTFAEKYNIDPLRRLSLHKLQRTLAAFTLYGERVDDVVNLMRYSYSNTPDRLDSIDDLRLLVVRYVACAVEDLAQSAEFQSLLGDAGSLATDLITEMLKRLD